MEVLAVQGVVYIRALVLSVLCDLLHTLYSSLLVVSGSFAVSQRNENSVLGLEKGVKGFKRLLSSSSSERFSSLSCNSVEVL